MTRRERLVARIAQAIIDDDPRAPWPTRAACTKNPGIVDHTRPPAVWDALKLCASCPVTTQCHAWAEEDQTYVGVAGGVVWTSRHRRRRSTTTVLKADAS